MENYLKLQPTKGKYIKISCNGKTYEIFKVDPRTTEFGTRIARPEAILLIESYPNLVTLVQQVKDGKLVKQITDEEIAQIQQNQLDRKLGMAVETTTVSETKSSGSDAALLKLVESQSKMIEDQAKAIAALQDQMKKITKTTKSETTSSKKGSEDGESEEK